MFIHFLLPDRKISLGMADTASTGATLGTHVISSKVRAAIQAKLKEIGSYVDDELPDYIMVMIANKRTRTEMECDLALFLGPHTKNFTSWLHDILHRLQDVVVPGAGDAAVAAADNIAALGGGDEKKKPVEKRKKEMKKKPDKPRLQSSAELPPRRRGRRDDDAVSLVDEAVRDLFDAEESSAKKERRGRAVVSRPPPTMKSSVGKISRAEECDDYEAVRSKAVRSPIVARPASFARTQLPERLRPNSNILLKALKDARTGTIDRKYFEDNRRRRTRQRVSAPASGANRTALAMVSEYGDMPDRFEEDDLPIPPSAMLQRPKYDIPDPNSLGISLLRANLDRERRKNEVIEQQLKKEKKRENKKLRELQKARKDVKKVEKKRRKAALQAAAVAAQAAREVAAQHDFYQRKAMAIDELEEVSEEDEEKTPSEEDELDAAHAQLLKRKKEMLDKITITVSNDNAQSKGSNNLPVIEPPPYKRRMRARGRKEVEEGEVSDEGASESESEELAVRLDYNSADDTHPATSPVLSEEDPPDRPLTPILNTKSEAKTPSFTVTFGGLSDSFQSKSSHNMVRRSATLLQPKEPTISFQTSKAVIAAPKPIATKKDTDISHRSTFSLAAALGLSSILAKAKPSPALSQNGSSKTPSKHAPIVYSLPPASAPALQTESDSSSATPTTTPATTTGPRLIPSTLPTVRPPHNIVQKERCMYWPNCRVSTSKCPFLHPAIPCKKFPVCSYGDSCLFIHPPCKFDARCTNAKCVFFHTKPSERKKRLDFSPTKSTDPTTTPKATGKNCFYGEKCTNVKCTFLHPKGKNVYKWSSKTSL